MKEHLRAIYRNHQWAKVIAFGGLLAGGALLYSISDGFPPWAWRFLFQVLLQLPLLWLERGPAILSPLAGLLLLSLALLILWVVLTAAAIQVGRDFWQAVTERELPQPSQASRSLQSSHFPEQAPEYRFFESDENLAGPAVQNARRKNTARAAWTQHLAEPSHPHSLAHAHSLSQSRPLSPGPAVANFSPQAYAASASWIEESKRMMIQSFQDTPDAKKVEAVEPVKGVAPYAHATTTRSPAVQPASRFSARSTQSLPVPDQASANLTAGRVARVAGREPQPISLPGDSSNGGEPAEPREDAPYIAPHDTMHVISREKSEHSDTRATFDDPDTPDEDYASESLEDQEYEEYTEYTRDTAPLPAAGPAGCRYKRLLIGARLDPGVVRRQAPNEDTLLALQGMHAEIPTGLFVVADGMGGHANGQEASRLAVQTLGDTIVPLLTRSPSNYEESFAELLKDGAHKANLAIYRRNHQRRESADLDMMGTTLTAALVIADTAYVVNVGDSRTYLYRKTEGLRTITRDHSIVARMVEVGLITADEIYTHPKRNQIYRCLGEHAAVDIDTFELQLQAGDILLLCSDGLWEMVRDSEIASIIEAAAPSPARISTRLLQAALDHGGADNISIIVAYLAPDEETL